MTEQQQAMRMALEALLEINELSKGENAICLPAEIDTAMDALRQALEQQPAREDWGPGPHEVHSLEQQPAAPAMFGGGLVAIKTLLSRDPCAHAKVAIEMIDAMLANQPAAQFVGLTDEEIGDALSVWEMTEEWPTFAYAARAIEQRLKEKNT